MDTSCQNTISGLLRPARTETVEHTITGLLAKRADLFNEAERIRDRLPRSRMTSARLTAP
jgi:hypothetical protein